MRLTKFDDLKRGDYVCSYYNHQIYLMGCVDGLDTTTTTTTDASIPSIILTVYRSSYWGDPAPPDEDHCIIVENEDTYVLTEDEILSNILMDNI